MGVIRKKTASRGTEAGTKFHCDVCSIDVTSTVSCRPLWCSIELGDGRVVSTRIPELTRHHLLGSHLMCTPQLPRIRSLCAMFLGR